MKGDKLREWHGLLPRIVAESLDASLAEVKGGAVPRRGSTPRRSGPDHQGVNRFDGREGGRSSEGG